VPNSFILGQITDVVKGKNLDIETLTVPDMNEYEEEIDIYGGLAIRMIDPDKTISDMQNFLEQ